MGKRRPKIKKRQRYASMKRKCEAMLMKRMENRANRHLNIINTPDDAVDGRTDIQEVTVKNKHVESKIIQEEIDMVFQPEEIETTAESGDDTKYNINESGNDAPCETRSNEELWVVRRQLCRGCHSDGAFWSLQSTTEGDTYEHLMQTYFNIQLCPVAEDEHALSAICTLCAARLREARAFSAQAHAAEEHFTRLYKQNRVRVFVNEERIKEEETFNEADDSQTANNVQPDTADSNLGVSNLALSDYKRVGKSYKCSHCDKMYAKCYIQQHVKTQHSISAKKNLGNKIKYKLSPSDFECVENLYKCTHCEKLFGQYSTIRSHMMHKHLKIPRYTCPNCDKTFNFLAAFNKHKLEEHSIDNRIKCNACDYFTYRKSALNKHKNNFHMLGVKLFCKDCGYSSYCHINMKKHAIKHSTVKEHHCKFCKKSFLRKSTLQYHERIHTGDKRKVCKVCGEAFVQRASLKYHMEKHHPEVRD